MESKNEFEVSVFAGKRSWYELVLASVFLGVFVYLLLYTLYDVFIEASLGLFIRNFYLTIAIGGFCLIKGLIFSMTKNLFIDIDTNTIISRYVVGPFSYDVKSKVTEFEYVSFFKDKFDCYGTNLWYVKNRHYKMYSFEDKESAYKFALEIANKLNIDLLDATEKGNSKWIEKSSL